MHKIMGLDVGTKRIGVALSDYLHISATPHSCIDRCPENSALDKIEAITKENNVRVIVIGLPLNMDNTKGSQAEDCINFSKLLKSKINGCDIILEDERLTSDLAEERLKERKVNFRKNKSLVDIESACIILEQYLNKIQ